MTRCDIGRRPFLLAREGTRHARFLLFHDTYSPHTPSHARRAARMCTFAAMIECWADLYLPHTALLRQLPVWPERRGPRDADPLAHRGF